MNFDDQIEYKRIKSKLQNKTKEEKLKLIWQWIKQDHINFAFFKQLIKEIDNEYSSNW